MSSTFKIYDFEISEVDKLEFILCNVRIYIKWISKNLKKVSEIINIFYFTTN